MSSREGIWEKYHELRDNQDARAKWNFRTQFCSNEKCKFPNCKGAHSFDQWQPARCWFVGENMCICNKDNDTCKSFHPFERTVEGEIIPGNNKLAFFKAMIEDKRKLVPAYVLSKISSEQKPKISKNLQQIESQKVECENITKEITKLQQLFEKKNVELSQKVEEYNNNMGYLEFLQNNLPKEYKQKEEKQKDDKQKEEKQKDDKQKEEKQKDFKNTKFCEHVTKDSECSKAGCTFAHSIDDLNPVKCRYHPNCRRELKECMAFHDTIESKEEWLVKNGKKFESWMSKNFRESLNIKLLEEETSLKAEAAAEAVKEKKKNEKRFDSDGFEIVGNPVEKPILQHVEILPVEKPESSSDDDDSSDDDNDDDDESSDDESSDDDDGSLKIKINQKKVEKGVSKNLAKKQNGKKVRQNGKK